MNTDLMFSSKTDKWNTPQHLIDDLATVFDWDVDVCASSNNVCDYYWDEDDNGLFQRWGNYPLRWCNPPYGRGKSGSTPWIEKAFCSQSLDGVTVMLLPARTDTKIFHECVSYASQIVFIKGRLKFGNATNSAPFPSCFVVFGELSKIQRSTLASYGMSVTP